MISANGFSYSMGNTKMNAVMSFSVAPHATCNPKAPCVKKGCYAWKFFRMYPAVGKAWQKNTDLLMEGKWTEFINDTVNAIKFTKVDKFRFNVAGDLFSVDYLNAIIEIVKKCRETKFWLYTKRWDILNRYIMRIKDGKPVFGALPMPRNLKIILSCWNEFQAPDDLKALFPTAHLDDGKHKNLLPKNGFVCQGDCENCMICANLKKGQAVIFHRH